MIPSDQDRFRSRVFSARPRWRRGIGLLAAGLLLVLQACAARQEAPAPAAPAPPTGSQPAAPTEVAPLTGRFLADAREYPWSAIGRVNLAGRGFCNGIVIGARHVLTQAQCLYTGREGRWWQPAELHFIAAYQRDVFLADSKIARFVTAPGYNPTAGASLANLTSNWAILELAAPVGLKTGWLGLRRNDERLKAAEAGGRAVFLRAGYRSDRPHALSVFIGCKDPALGAIDLCAATPVERALPPFVMIDGQMQVVADHFVQGAALETTLAEIAATFADAPRFGDPGLPQADSPVRRNPTATAATLLQALGYPAAARNLPAATAQYLKDGNLPADLKDGIGLLAALVATAQSGAAP